MKEKIMNIKNILRIIISLFVIFSMIKSCAKAYTFDEFVAFSEQVAELDEADTDTHLAARWLVSNADRIKSELSTNIDRLSSHMVWYTPSNSFYRYVGVEVGDFTGWKNDTTSYLLGNSDYKNGRCQNNGTWYQYINDKNSTFRYCLFDESIADSIDFTGRIGNNYYSTFDMAFTHNFSNNYTYNNETIQAVELNYNNSKVFIESIAPTDNVTSIKAYLDNFELEVIDVGTWATIGKYLKLSELNMNQVYTLKVSCVYEGDIEEIEEKVIFVPVGTIIENGNITYMPSGENFNTQNATNQIIDNQNKNQNWLEETYNNLFVMESGDVEELVENMKANLQISNIGDLSGEKAILETLTGEPSDFIIAWNSTQYMGKTIIPSGEINFSQKVREVPALQTTQNWLRIIMGYSISVVLLSEIFFTILKVLGVSVSIYDQHNEEIERLEEMHTPKVYDTEVITPKGVKRYRTRRTRIQ